MGSGSERQNENAENTIKIVPKYFPRGPKIGAPKYESAEKITLYYKGSAD